MQTKHPCPKKHSSLQNLGYLIIFLSWNIWFVWGIAQSSSSSCLYSMTHGFLAWSHSSHFASPGSMDIRMDHVRTHKWFIISVSGQFQYSQVSCYFFCASPSFILECKERGGKPKVCKVTALITTSQVQWQHWIVPRCYSITAFVWRQVCPAQVLFFLDQELIQNTHIVYSQEIYVLWGAQRWGETFCLFALILFPCFLEVSLHAIQNCLEFLGSTILLF